MKTKRSILLVSVFFVVFLMLIVPGAYARVSGGGGGSNTYYSLSGSLSASPTTVNQGQVITLTLSVSSFSNDPTAVFQITSSSGTENVHSVTVTSDSGYSYTWNTNLAGSLGFRVQYVSEVSSSGSVSYSYINGVSLYVNTRPSISSVNGSPNPVAVNSVATFNSVINWNGGSNQASQWTVSSAPGHSVSSDQYMFTQSGSYTVTLTVSSNLGTASKSFVEVVDVPVYITIETSLGIGGANIGGQYYSSGQVATLLDGVGYSISPVSSGFFNGYISYSVSFLNWATTAGTLSNSYAPDTMFYPNSNGYLNIFWKMDLNQSFTGLTQYSPGGISFVTGTFQVPSTSYNANMQLTSDYMKKWLGSYYSETETQAIYVGLGGATLESLGGGNNPISNSNRYNDLTVLGGVLISYSDPGSSPVYTAFTAYGTQSDMNSYVLPLNLNINQGDLITVGIYASSNSTSVTVIDDTTGAVPAVTNYVLPITANYAEWQTQLGGQVGPLSFFKGLGTYVNIGMDFSPIQFTDSFSNAGDYSFALVSPLSCYYSSIFFPINNSDSLVYQQFETVSDVTYQGFQIDESGGVS